MKKNLLAMVAVALLAGPMAAEAGTVFAFEEVGGNVVGTLSGSLNLAGFNTFGPSICVSSADFINVVAAAGAVEASEGLCDVYHFDVDPVSFGTFSFFGPGYSGDMFWAAGSIGRVAVARDYVFGTSLAGSATWLSSSFASLGLVVGDHTWVLPNDTITFRVGSLSVPEPGTLALFGLGLAGLGFARRRRATN